MILDEIAKLQEKDTPPQYILCGIERYKTLMQESLMRESLMHSSLTEGLGVPVVTTYMGVRIVVSDKVAPDFIQVLPGPEAFLRPATKM